MEDIWPQAKKARLTFLRKRGNHWPVIAEQLGGATPAECEAKYEEICSTTREGQEWTKEEIATLCALREEGKKSWQEIGQQLNRNAAGCRMKYFKIEKKQHRVRPWTEGDVAMLMTMRGKHIAWSIISQQLERNNYDCRAKYKEEICKTLLPVPDYTGGGAFTMTLSTTAYDMTAGHPPEERLAAMKKFRESLVTRYEGELRVCDSFIQTLTSQNHESGSL